MRPIGSVVAHEINVMWRAGLLVQLSETSWDSVPLKDGLVGVDFVLRVCSALLRAVVDLPAVDGERVGRRTDLEEDVHADCRAGRGSRGSAMPAGESHSDKEGAMRRGRRARGRVGSGEVRRRRALPWICLGTSVLTRVRIPLAAAR